MSMGYIKTLTQEKKARREEKESRTERGSGLGN
jgi:hypothetical protein